MQQEAPHPLTGTGKILFLVTILLFGFGMFVLFTDVFIDLPSGSYPLFVLLGPLVLACLALFYGGGAILKRKGYPIFTADLAKEDEIEEKEE